MGIQNTFRMDKNNDDNNKNNVHENDDDDSDEELSKWLYQRRTSTRVERRPTALFDMETTAELAATQLKIQQEIRRNQLKDKIKARLQNRHGFDNNLLASSDSNIEVDSMNSSDIDKDHIIGNSDDDFDNDNPVVVVRAI